MSFILEAEQLTKIYRKQTVLHDVSLKIEENAFCGIIGERGAGKTVLLKLLSGLAVPSSGSVRYRGASSSAYGIGVTTVPAGLYLNLSARSNLEIKRLALGLPDTGRTDELLALTGLSQYGGVKTRSYTRSMRNRLALALALYGEPELLLLDEPLFAAQESERLLITRLLKSIHEEKHTTVVYTSESTQDFSGITDCFLMLNNGSLDRSQSADDLKSALPGYIRITADPLSGVKAVLEEMRIFSYQTKGINVLYVMEQPERAEEIRNNCLNAGIRITECRVVYETAGNGRRY